MITTVLLDLDDTILSDDEASDIAFAATARIATERAGVNATDLTTAIKQASSDLWRELPFPDWLSEVGTGPLELLRARFEGDDPHWATMRDVGPVYRRDSWIRALATFGVQDDALAADLDAAFERERAAANPWCEGAEQALDWLGEHYKLGMVTNGIPDVQWTKIHATGIEPRFDAIVVSGEVGYGKPHPVVYRRALELIGSEPSETIMVGDNWRRDAIGPKELGIRCVWLSMGRPRPDEREPWLEVRTLADLPAELAR